MSRIIATAVLFALGACATAQPDVNASVGSGGVSAGVGVDTGRVSAGVGTGGWSIAI